MTVLNNDGLVGRVLRVDPHHRHRAARSSTPTPSSAAGSARAWRSASCTAAACLGDDGRLDLELVDQTVVPAKHDTVVTWGSEGGAPYVSGVPVGRVTAVYSSLRETSQRAVIEPFVDFGSLDLVGVVVPSGTASDRAVIEADGSLR